MDDIKIFKEQLNLDDVQAAMLSEEQLEIPLQHTFSGGVYIRQIFVPKGALILGKRHRHKTCNILLMGDMSVYMSGARPVRIKAPLIFESEPNVRKLAYCHEDVLFMNIHPTDETDLEKIEKRFIIGEDEFKKLEGSQKCLG